MKKLLKNMLVWDSSMVNASRHDVTVEGGLIHELLPVGMGTGDVLFDGEGHCALIPGLVNAHTHAAMSLVRGLGEELPLMEWLKTKIWPAEEKIGAKHVEWGTRLALLEMLSSGITCFADMYFFMEQVADVALESGVRSALCRGIVGAFDDQFENKLAEGIQLATDYNRRSTRLIVHLGPHAPYTILPEQIERVVEEAKARDLGVHLHWLETQDEVDYFKENLKMSPDTYLEKTGLLDVKELLLPHSVWQTVEGLPALAKGNITVVHNPKSNLKLGSGFAPIKEMLASGVRVALGTDGAASNNRLDIWDEMRTCALMHKGYHQDPTLVSAREVLKMATVNGAHGVGFGDVGLLQPGAPADFIAVELDQPQYIGVTEENLPEFLVYAGSSRDVRMTAVEGKALYSDGAFLTLDRERILTECATLRKEIVGAN